VGIKKRREREGVKKREGRREEGKGEKEEGAAQKSAPVIVIMYQ